VNERSEIAELNHQLRTTFKQAAPRVGYSVFMIRFYRMKRLYLVAAIVVLIVSIIVAVWIFAASRSSPVRPIQTDVVEQQTMVSPPVDTAPRISFQTYKDDQLGVSVSIPITWSVKNEDDMYTSHAVGFYSPEFSMQREKDNEIGADDIVTQGARFFIEPPQGVNEKLWQQAFDGRLDSQHIILTGGRGDEFLLTTVHKSKAGKVEQYRILFDYKELSPYNEQVLSEFVKGFEFLK
jgi:hypothetical protein